MYIYIHIYMSHLRLNNQLRSNLLAGIHFSNGSPWKNISANSRTSEHFLPRHRKQ